MGLQVTGNSATLLVEEVGGFQRDDLPAFRAALQLKAHLSAAALRSGQDVAGVGVHIDVGDGGTAVFVGRHLQKLVAKADAVVAAKEGHHLVLELGEVLHVLAVEDVEDAVEVVGFDTALKVVEHVAYHLVGKVDGLRCRGGGLFRWLSCGIGSFFLGLRAGRASGKCGGNGQRDAEQNVYAHFRAIELAEEESASRTKVRSANEKKTA